MKCEAGKCSTGKDDMKKVPVIKEEKSPMPNMSTKEHEEMLKDESETPQKVQERKNKRVIKQLFNVRTVKVIKKQSTKEQVNYGYVVVEESKRVEVSSWFSGYVEVLYANTTYKKVEKGEALAKVYSAEVYKAKQDYLNSIHFNTQRSAKGMLRGAKEKLRLLNVSKKEIDLIKTSRKVNEYTTIYAPISGWIFEKSINVGSSFKKQQKLFEIVNLDSVWVEAKIFQKDLKNLDSLENFNIKVKGYDELFSAKKELLYPMLDPKDATFTLRLSVKNKNNILKPGMYTTLHSSAKSKNELLIPRTAALRKSSQWYVFLATEFKGEYEPVKVDIVPLDSEYFIVKSGLTEGENIVNNALFMMDSDAQINSIY
jgi:Cu(I)/Ag(I) efflux system membrane fusion protein